MSHIGVKKILFPKTEYAGQKWFFDFLEIPVNFEENKVQNYISGIQKTIKPITQSWTAELNTE